MEAVIAAERSGVVDAPDFDSWVAARGPALLRLAYTLTGNRSVADGPEVADDRVDRTTGDDPFETRAAVPRGHRPRRGHPPPTNHVRPGPA